MAPSVQTLEKYLEEATRQLYSADEVVTVNAVRRRAEEDNGLETGFFAAPDWKSRSSKLVKQFHGDLVAEEPPSSIPEPKRQQDIKNGAKRSSSDEPSPAAKRQKKTTPNTTSRNTKAKSMKEAPSSGLSELDDSEVEPKKKNKNSKQTRNKRASAQKQPSESELSDLDMSEDEPKPKKTTKKPAAPRKSKKKETESELSDLDSAEDEPKAKKVAKKPAAPPKAKKEVSESELSDFSSPEDEPKPKKVVKKPAASKISKKEESESDLSDLDSSEVETEPKKKGGRKSVKHEDSNDDKDDKKDKDKASMSKSKRKQSTPKAKPHAKRAKLESDSEEKTVVEKKIDDDEEADVDVKTDDEKATTQAKPEKGDSRLSVANDSDSSLSSVLDEPPVRKQKGKDSKAAPKASRAVPKEVTGDDAEIKKLQGQLVKCGVRKIWGIELKQYGSDTKARIRHLKNMLREVGMDGRFSEAKAREIKEKRELLGELEAVNEMNELWGVDGPRGRVSRSKSVRKSMKEESEEDEDEEKPKGEDDDEEEAKVKTNPRVSKRMADLAFLGSESESD